MAKSKKIKIDNLFLSIVLIVCGILFCAFRSGMIDILLTIIGVLVIVAGILDIIAKKYIYGAVEIAIGIVIIILGWKLFELTLLIIGIIFIVIAVIDIIKIVSEKKVNKKIISPILLMILGILLIIARFTFSDIICIVIGVYLIVYGVLLFLGKKKNK